MCTIPMAAQNLPTSYWEPEIDTLRPAVITSNKQTSPARTTSPVNIIDKDRIERLGLQELTEVIRTFSGASIKDYGGLGGIKTVSIRNLGSQHTAVCYDGVSISNVQNGQIDIGRFSIDNVEKISLSIGQSDDIFTSARMYASAGVLNIKTVHPHFDEDKPVNISAKIRIASFGTYNPFLLYEQRLSSKWILSASGDWLTSKGEYPFTIQNGDLVTKYKRRNSDINSGRAELNLFGDMGKSGRLSIKANWLGSVRGLPGSVVLYDTTAYERLWDQIGFANVSYDNDLGEKWKIAAKVNYQYAWNKYRDQNEQYPDGLVEDQYTQMEYYGSLSAMYSPFDFLHFAVAEDFFVNTLTATIPECPFPIRYSSLTSLSAQYTSNRLTATVSALGTFVKETVKVGEAASDKWRISPAASISFKLLSDYDFRIRASYKDGFRVPTFNDLYYARVGNRNLAPEKASQFNLGLTWSGQLLNGVIDYSLVTIDGYYNGVRDKIVAIPTMFIWKMINYSRVDIAGLDVNAAISFSLPHKMSINLSGSYSYQYAVDATDPQSKTYHNQIPYTPVHSGNISLSWTNKWVNISYLMTAVGERYCLPQNIPSNLIEGYFDHTISANHTFHIGRCQLKLLAEVLNVANAQYDIIKFYPMPGRSYRFTLKFTY